jgi:HSP20 family protein
MIYTGIEAAQRGKPHQNAHSGQWIEHVLGPNYRKFSPGETWTPAVNIYETPRLFCVLVELAGIKAEQIDLRMEGGKLVISGQRPAPNLPESDGVVRLHHMEIDHGHFCRSLELPPEVNGDEIEAFHQVGFLWIYLPKTK